MTIFVFKKSRVFTRDFYFWTENFCCQMLWYVIVGVGQRRARRRFDPQVGELVFGLRLLELEFLAKQALRPLRVFLVAENPAVHVLRLHDENAIAGYDHMVDLRGAVGGGYGDVID